MKHILYTGFSSEIGTKLRDWAGWGAAATLGQHCPQMIERRCIYGFFLLFWPAQAVLYPAFAQDSGPLQVNSRRPSSGE